MARTKLKRMKRIPGGKRRRLPTLTGADPKISERAPDALQSLIADLGGSTDDIKLAKQVLKLKTDFPAASIPELVVYVWLQAHGIPFEFQAMLYGGRRSKGGLVPDFVLQYGSKGMAWQVEGEYWHRQDSSHGQKDATVRLRLLGATYKGIRIDTVVSLWERDIYRKRPTVFLQALLGIGLRG